MKKGISLLSLIGLVSLVTAGFVSASTPVEAAMAADTSSSSTTYTGNYTAGTIFYVNFSKNTSGSTSWYNGGDSFHKFALKFTASDNTTTAFSSYMSHAYGGDKFMCAYIPSKGSVSIWKTVSVYCYSSDVATPVDSGTGILAYTAGQIAVGNEISLFGDYLGKGTGNNGSMLTFPQSGQTQNLDFDKASIWCHDNLLELTGTYCSSLDYSGLSTCWSYLSGLWTNNTGITDAGKTIFQSSTNAASPVYSTAGAANETICQAKARYLRIRELHNYDDFAGLNTSGAAVLTQTRSSSENSVLLISLSASAALLTASYFFFKKKRVKA
jgi:hypothetical protein